MVEPDRSTPYGVPTLSAVLFAVVIVVFGVLALLTFDATVGLVTWVLRIAGAGVWGFFLVRFGLRDILAKKAGTADIDHTPFDRWSWIHMTAGCLAGLWSVPFGLVALMTLAWEVFEYLVPGFGETETIGNRTVDVLGAWLGWVGCALLVASLEGGPLPLFQTDGPLLTVR